MISYPQINPEIVRVGPLAVRWYGMMYLAGFAASYLLVKYQIKKKGQALEKDFVESLYSYLILGLLLGARLGYVVFYNLAYYVQHPLEVFAVWHGGMSFHGGLIGSIAAGILFCRSARVDFWLLADFVIATAPIGLGLGRLGNFINGELYGRPSDVPWAMVFPTGGPLPRHPSQLYELFLEGVVLFTVLWMLRSRKMGPGTLTAVFIMLYGLFRFVVEFFREPDPQLGYIIGGIFTMGQALSASMIVAGAVIYYLRKRATA
ncbi:MAG TPA: prolipoprotein diacylglyceryl transferase [Dissulfurispiraceae bacterium]